MEAICANPDPIYLMQPARSDSLINVTRDLSSKRRVARLYSQIPRNATSSAVAMQILPISIILL